MKGRCLQVIVNGMRVRIKLDEERIAELIRGTEPSAIPGLMRHLGNVASLSFTPYQNSEFASHSQTASHIVQILQACGSCGPDQGIFVMQSQQSYNCHILLKVWSKL